MPKFYAVRRGRQPGIYMSWDECKTQTTGYAGTQFKSFKTREEAEQFMNSSISEIRKPYVVSNRIQRSGDQSGDQSGDSNDSSDRLCIYTDGSCHGNGFRGAKAGIGVHFPNNSEWDISEKLTGRPTNNRAEIMAATRALQVAKQKGFTKVEIKTDSQFMISSITEWCPAWRRRGWKKSDGSDVINKQDFIKLEAEAQGMDIKWVKVKAHRGETGNEMADQLANKGSRRMNSNVPIVMTHKKLKKDNNINNNSKDDNINHNSDSDCFADETDFNHLLQDFELKNTK
ncbi:ribonuclease H1-like [Oppia nitens]|uniref:ribonuclease H1-like n=1 Tax=Oppia nitens TaxID=1686743 RepID=UPI0023DACE4B|nr:ribonuclease H1-like [Oppia nitens]